MKILVLLNIACLVSAVCFASLAMAKDKEKAPLPPGWEKPATPKSDRLVRVAIESSEIVEIHAKPSRLVTGPDGSSGVVQEGKALPPGYRAAEEPVSPPKKTGTSKGIPRTGPVPAPAK